MANLKGGSYAKQVKDAFHRLAAFGEKRYGSDDHLTHSDALAVKREMFLNDLREFATVNNFSAKLNLLMGNVTVMDDFLDQRTKDLSYRTAENYLRGFSSMIKGLREKNVTISDRIAEEFFDSKLKEMKKNLPNSMNETGRSIKNPEAVINDLYEKSYESGLIAEVLNTLGLRITEGYELIQNSQRYIRENMVIGLTGKGNHVYIAKAIPASLVHKISIVEKLPVQDTFREHLHQVTNNRHKPHDFRFTAANRMFYDKLADGKTYREAMKEVSLELNHTREEMTQYYLSRA